MANTQTFYYVASPGIAYVDGYRVEIQSPRKIEVQRAITTEWKANDKVTANFGNYIQIRDFAGTIDIQNNPVINFYSANQQILSYNQSMTNPLGTQVGTANIRSIEFDSGVKGTNTAIYNIFLYNIIMNPGPQTSFGANARSIYVDGAFGKVFGDVIANNNNTTEILDTKDLKRLVFPTGYQGVKRLTSNTGVNATNYVYRTTLEASLVPSGASGATATFTLSGGDTFNYGTGFLSDLNSADLNLTFKTDTYSNTLITNGSFSGLSACTTGTASSANITSPTSFTGGLYVGHAIYAANGATEYIGTIIAINSANSIQVAPQPANTNPGTMHVKQFFKKGTHVNFTGSGNTINFNSSTQVTATLCLTPDGNGYALKAQIPSLRSSAVPIKKIVNKNLAVKIDPSTSYATTIGPWGLGMSDVYRIANVHVGTTYSESNPDRKEWFQLITGQQDYIYGHSKLSLLPKYTGAITSASRLLVKVDAFTANITTTQAVFFSIDSYPIDDANTANTGAIATAQIPQYIDSSGLSYDLRNYIDFRTVLANTANITTVSGSATTNPVNNYSTFVTGSGTSVAFEPDSTLYYNIEYYLPRRDILVLNKDGSLAVKLGQPALNPKPAAINKSGISIAEIFVPPYPSLTFTEAE